jgi:hypothetical protein
MKVTIGSSVERNSVLWRYMSLDKLIHLLDTKELFFTPLESYRSSDPFEGYIPDVAASALADILGYQVKELEKVNHDLSSLGNPNSIEKLSKLTTNIEGLGDQFEYVYNKLVKGITVNCWHQNSVESEAMWKLYSDDSKGIAIKSSVNQLITALEGQAFDKTVQIGAVKYLDFSDPNITTQDCLSDGHLAPLLKRSSYKHEHEIRSFIVNPFSDEEAKADFTPVDIDKLIDTIYISPFASEPFVSSVYAICDKYGIKHKVIKSDLLDHSKFLSKLTKW